MIRNLIQLGLILMILAGCSTQTIQNYKVPDNFVYVQEIVKAMEKKNIEIKDIQRSKMESLFKTVYDAAFIDTNKGVLEVVYVTDADPRELKIIPSEKGYVLKQHEHLRDQDLQFQTENESFFIQTEKFFMHTKNKDLYTALKNFK